MNIGLSLRKIIFLVLENWSLPYLQFLLLMQAVKEYLVCLIYNGRMLETDWNLIELVQILKL